MTDPKLARESTDTLVRAFATFATASNALENAYCELQSRVEYLTGELEQSNYYLSSVLQSLPCGVLVIDQDGQVTMLNQLAKNLFDVDDVKLPLALSELLGSASFSERAEKVQASGLDTTEIRLKGTSDRGERIVLCSWSRIRDEERVLVVQDITEMRELEGQVQRSERAAAMGKMALELAHEIRNPLAALELFASLLNEDDLSSEDRSRYLSSIQIGIRSLNTVLTNMLTFSRSSSAARERVGPEEVLEEMVEFMRPLLKQRGIEVHSTFKNRSEIEVDREMFRQILTNLFTNALQAMPGGGFLELKTSQEQETVFLRIRDNGVGIASEHQGSIFDSGFTTRAQGNGLGLAIVNRFMESHQGKISVTSRKGWGTEFCLTFPGVEDRHLAGGQSTGTSRRDTDVTEADVILRESISK